MTLEDLKPMENRPQPDRGAILAHPRLTVVKNALALTLLGRVRDRRTDFQDFAGSAGQLAGLALWEACRDIPLREIEAEGFTGEPIVAHEPAERIAGVAILRAGLIFQPAFRGLLPHSPLHHLGIKRDEATLEPHVYASNLPDRPGWADRIIMVDPMLATGGTARAAIELIRQHHDGALDFVCLVAAPLGVEVVVEADPDVQVVTIALDERLNEIGFILPGLGDAGDRYFGTP